MQKLKTVFLSIAGASVISACASSPDSIGAAHVSSLQYQSYTCKQLQMESARVSGRTQDVYNQVKKLSDDDAIQTGVGLVLFWPALFFLEGGDGPQAAEFSRLKGEANAIEQAAVAKECVGKIEKWSPPPPPKDAES